MSDTKKQTELERLDDLLIGDMKIYQRTDQFCFSIDAVLLAHFVQIRDKHYYADFGTGTGVIALLLAGRGAKHIAGLEINPIMADLAQRNVTLNGKQAYISIYEDDYRKPKFKSEYGQFDDIVINPPYRPVGQGKISAFQDKALALHEVETTLAEVISSARKLLRYGGHLWLIHLAERLGDVIEQLRQEKLEPKKIRFVHSKAEDIAKFVLIEARYGGKPGLAVLPPLYIYDVDGIYTEEVRHWYGR